MQAHRAHIIVRTAALLTGSLALVALSILAYQASRPETPDFHGMLPLLIVVAIIPLIFIWSAIQAWRFRPSGIVTVSSSWVLFGIGGTIVHLFWFLSDWRSKDAFFAAMWVFVFFFGILVSRQEKTVANDVA